MSETRRSHWQRVYRDKAPTAVSWYQAIPETSLQLIRATGVHQSEPIIDVGGGASTLVDHLLAEGYEDVTVLDVSAEALQRSRERLGDGNVSVHWIDSDVLTFVPSRRYAIWHDRAVFHFLNDPEERDKYIDVAGTSLQPDGHLLLATFGPDGPERCSGLPIQRYSIDKQQQLFGARFTLGGSKIETHETPMGSSQQFIYSWWQLRGQ
ncbi:MAG: class I SAM-dependent methyltransferase [Woeseiaceae bacterium]